MCYSISKKNKSMIKSDNCSNRLYPFKAEDLENIIINEIQNFARDPKLIYDTIEDTTPENSTVAIQERLDNVNNQISKLLDLYQLGFTDISQISEKLNCLKDEREKLEKQISEETVTRTMSPSSVIKILKDFDEVLENGTPEEIHNLVHTLIDKIIVLNDQIKIFWSFC